MIHLRAVLLCILLGMPLFGQLASIPGGAGGSNCTGSASVGYVGTATGTGTNPPCTWQAVGSASVTETAIANAEYVAVTGTNTLTGTTTTSYGSLNPGYTVKVKIQNTNTGAVTLNVNSIGATAVTKNGSTALVGGELQANQQYILQYDGTEWQITATYATATSPITISATSVIACATCGVTGSPLSQFAATTSAQLAGVISDETGTAALVFANGPTLVAPVLGTPASGTLTNATGLPLAGLVNPGANTILGNYTAGTAAVTAGAAPSGGTTGCSGTTDAVTYTTSTGWGCHQISGGGSTAFSGLTTSTNTTAAMTVGSGASLTFSGTGTNTASTVKGNTLTDANGNPFLISSATTSAVDSVTVTNAATANPATVTVGATGSDSNINLSLVGKGTGSVQFPNGGTTGSSPPASSVCAAGTGGMWCFGNGIAPSGTFTGATAIWGDSTQNGLMSNYNGGGNKPIPQSPTSTTSADLTCWNSTNGSLLSDCTAIPSATTATTQAATDNSTKIATTAYVTTGIANAVNAAAGRDLVSAASAAVLPNSPTYNNGVAGIGATLTSGSNIALVVDGYTCVLNDRILVKNQATAAQNGIYYCSQVGTGVLPWILTRALDYDQPSDMNNTIVPVANHGTVNPLTSWIMTSVVATVGTDAVNFASFTPNGANIVTSASPGAGVAHFAGSTQSATSSAVVSADLNITTTTCTAPQILTAISATAIGTCTAPIMTLNSQSAAYTTVLGDAGKMIVHPSADTTARTFTIDSNANVAYVQGTCLTFNNQPSAGTLTIAITADTLVFYPGTGTGSRTLAAGNVATACKDGATHWFITGSSGLT